jgi:hypothetical protein
MAFGIGAIGRAPVLLVAAYLALIGIVLPAAAMLDRSLRHAFELRHLDPRFPGEVSAEWFEHARGDLDVIAPGTLAPQMFGFASTLSNLDDLVEGRLRGAVVLGTISAWYVVWTLLLGVALPRLWNQSATGRRQPAVSFVQYLPAFLIISCAALLVSSLALVVLWMLPESARPGALVVVMFFMGAVTVIATYSRALVVVEQSRAQTALEGALRLVRHSPGAATAHALLGATVWALPLAAFALLDLGLGEAVSPNAALALTQLVVIGRLFVRLVWEASAVDFVLNAGG